MCRGNPRTHILWQKRFPMHRRPRPQIRRVSPARSPTSPRASPCVQSLSMKASQMQVLRAFGCKFTPPASTIVMETTMLGGK